MSNSSTKTLPGSRSVPPAAQVPERPSDVPTVTDDLSDGKKKPLPKDRPSLTVLSGVGAGRLVPIRDGELIVGRDESAGLQMDDASLSRRHARCFCADGQVFVQDLGSTNGTYVRGKRIDAPCALEDGDHIGLGPDRLLRFNLYDALEEGAAVELYESSIADPTSGALTRKCFDQRLEAARVLAERNAQPLALLLIDIDHFKSVNDSHGHLVGDVVLRVLTANVRRLLRPEDLLGRYGGDELVVLCRDTSLRNGLILAERIRASVERLPFCAGGAEFHLTVSVGVAATPSPDGDALIGAADRAMYEAKRHGRNSTAGARGGDSFGRGRPGSAPGP